MGRENKYETGKYYSRLLIKGCTKRKQIVDYKGPLWQWLLQASTSYDTHCSSVTDSLCGTTEKDIFSLQSKIHWKDGEAGEARIWGASLAHSYLSFMFAGREEGTPPVKFIVVPSLTRSSIFLVDLLVLLSRSIEIGPFGIVQYRCKVQDQS